VVDVVEVIVVDVVVVVGSAVVVLDSVVVVVVAAHSPVRQASQQLTHAPTVALPPAGARHFSGDDLRLHVVVPPRVVRQQVTKPSLPQVDRDAQ
jgi:hypothetical protein